MGNNVPFFWFLDPNFLTFCAICGVGYGIWKVIDHFRP